MWQPSWNGPPFQGCPQGQDIGGPLGPHPGVLPCGGCGGCSPSVPTIWDLNFQHVGPRDNGYLKGHPSNMMNPPGMNCGCHHPGVPANPMSHGPPTTPFQSGGVNTLPGPDPAPNPTSPTPLPSFGMDISQLEERLGEAINKKFKSMTETLRAFMSTSMENTSTTATDALAKAPGSAIPPDPEPPTPSAPDGTTTRLPTPALAPASASRDAEPSDRPSMLTSKAKPPARPDEKKPTRSTRIPSRQRSTPRRSRRRNPSHSHSGHRRSLHRRRAHPDRHHRGDHGSPSPRSRHHDRPLPRARDMAEQLIRPIQVEKTTLILFITGPMQ